VKRRPTSSPCELGVVERDLVQRTARGAAHPAVRAREGARALGWCEGADGANYSWASGRGPEAVQPPVEASQDELHLDEGPFLLIEAQKRSGSAYLPSRRRAFFALFMNEILPIP